MKYSQTETQNEYVQISTGGFVWRFFLGGGKGLHKTNGNPTKLCVSWETQKVLWVNFEDVLRLGPGQYVFLMGDLQVTVCFNSKMV